MRITVALFLVLVLVFHTDYTHAQSSQPVPTTFTDILEISELRDTPAGYHKCIGDIMVSRYHEVFRISTRVLSEEQYVR